MNRSKIKKVRMYEKKDYKKFPVLRGHRICPSGDYRLIDKFENSCSFGDRSIFGKNTIFGDWSTFGRGCIFGDGIIFGNGSSFGNWSRFGKNLKIGKASTFGVGASFGEKTIFGDFSSFGNWAEFGAHSIFGKETSFGERSSFREHCIFEGGLQFAANERTYFVHANNIGPKRDGVTIFNSVEGIYIRCGKWLWREKDFLEHIHATYKNTAYAEMYRFALKMAQAQFGNK